MSYRKRRADPVIFDRCGECPKGKCDRCPACVKFAAWNEARYPLLRNENHR